MTRKCVLQLVLVFFGAIHSSKAQQNDIEVLNEKSPAFALVAGGVAASLCVSDQEEQVVHIAAQAFCQDVQTIADALPVLSTEMPTQGNVVIVGTIGRSAAIESIAAHHPEMADLRGKWESFCIKWVENPFRKGNRILVVAGSDPRGTAYGLFHLSRAIGVHPFHWWADIVPEKHKALYVKLDGSIVQSPSVKYRGIFLNDEDWGLQPWAAANMDTEEKDIGPRTYEKIFELLLRLKANYIWPAMHDCTKAFWFYKENPQLARRYAIVLGASHCEPMLRNNVFEWVEHFEQEYGAAPGPWRYDVNRQQIFTYWNDRVKEAKSNEAFYTIGMRGIHDGKMPGPETLDGKRQLMEQIIAEQRGMLRDNLGRAAEQVPQLFCPYKEVLDIYQSGLQLPDDVTIAWADDNHGYIRQLSNPEERKRSGGSGVYYHLSYWGKPADYLWLSSISPVLIAYEMGKAYHFGADRVWMFNVGDIKPAELEMQFALDFAWDVDAWPANKASDYTAYWAAEIFGASLAKPIAEIKELYYELAAAGKPEHLDKIAFTDGEAVTRLARYARIAGMADSLKSLVPERLQDAYFQLLYYPVMGAKLMNEKILHAHKSMALAERGQRDALTYSAKATGAYEQIQLLTAYYNEEMAKGKWKGMMDAKPRKQKVFDRPLVANEATIANRTSLAQQNDREWLVDMTTYADKDTAISFVKGLGINGNGITKLSWQERASNAHIPYISYRLQAEKGNRKVAVRCLPTFRLHEGKQLRYGISVNDGSIQWVDIHANAETEEWSVNVLRGYAQGISRHELRTDEVTIKLYFPDTGLVVNSIAVL